VFKKVKRKELLGVVTSDKMEKTLVVEIKKRIRHPLYGKVINKTKKVKVHDGSNECKVGDFIRLVESRPLSKDKRWCFKSFVKKAGEK